MIDLILIILLIVSISKPGVLLSKKAKEKANPQQQAILAKNMRKVYAIAILVLESVSLIQYSEIPNLQTIAVIATIISFILFIVISIPAIKEVRKMRKELGI